MEIGEYEEAIILSSLTPDSRVQTTKVSNTGFEWSS